MDRLMSIPAGCLALIVGLLLQAPVSRAADAPDDEKPIKALFVCGGCCHDYKSQQKIIPEGISARANVEWTIAYDPDSGTKHLNPVYENPEWYKGFDVIVHDECTADVKDPDAIARILKPHKDGLPGVVLHCAMHSYRSEGWPKAVTPWYEFTGLQTTHHRAQLPIEISYIDKENPITKGLENWTTIGEELYNNEIGKVQDTATPLARGKQGKDDDVCVWTNIYNKKARVFGTTVGHNNDTCNDPKYLDLVTRGLLWSLNKLDDKHLKPAKHVYAPLPAGKLVPENLSKNKPATASSTQNPNTAISAVDGDDSTRWCASGPETPQWWQVDLQKPEDLSGCQITWEQAANYKYKVLGSADAKTWTTLADATASAEREQVQKHKFDAKGIRYLRVDVIGTENGSWASIFEFEAYGTKMVAPPSADAGRSSDAARRLLREVKVPKGFTATLFAAPTDIDYPTCLAASPTGELFIGCDENGSLDQKPDRGRVVRCIDSQHNGNADQFNVFAKMDSPRGLFYDGGTLYVLHPPFLTAYHDEKGTGTSSRSEDLVTGLAHDLKWRGADHTTNGIQMGIDGWIYIAAGDYGAPHAVGKDGTELTLHGGGVLRVRPDGSGLEAVSHAQRNIYDVAIDPFMNIFTCDNTNDGDAWNVRLSNVFMTANFGYPSLFVNFPQEIAQPLKDYGDGSPTGVLYVDEPGLPEPYGRALYTCEWDFGTVFRHPLKASGASYEKNPPREKFVEIPRPTDVEVDGQSNVYVSSWRGGVFSYAGPNVGFVIRVTPDGAKPAPAPDLKKATDTQLVELLTSPSHFWRLHTQREILRRGDKPELDTPLEKLAAAAEVPLASRVAAIFTLRQLRGAASHPVLLSLLKDATVREFALRALADDKRKVADLATKPFTDALSDPDARVRLQAVIALGRLGHRQAATALVPLLADGDAVIAHAAVQNLILLHGTDACFAALDSGSPSVAIGAGRVLQAFHEPAVVDGLVSRVGKSNDAYVRDAVLKAMCRLYYREAEWTGDWWGTRPDTSGPYFHAVKWDQSEKLGGALRAALAASDATTLRTLITDLKLHKIDLPELNATMAKLADSDPVYRAKAIELVIRQRSIADDALPLLEKVATSEKEDAALRGSALRGLARSTSQAGFDSAVRAFTAVSKEAKQANDVVGAAAEYTRDGRRAEQVGQFVTLASNADPATRELAYRVLLFVSTSHQAKPEHRTTATQAIEKAWEKPESSVSLLRAIGQTHADQMAFQVRSRQKDEHADIRDAATYAAGQLELDKIAPSNEPLVSKIGFEAAIAGAMQDKGDHILGGRLFVRQGCVACHTLSQKDTPKGPFLGEVGSKYSRAELLESVLKPNAKIAQGFITNWFTLKNGTRPMGFIVRESGDTIEIRDVTGVSTQVPLKDIVKRGTLPTSVMPEGLADNLTVHDLASLMAYLESLKRN